AIEVAPTAKRRSNTTGVSTSARRQPGAAPAPVSCSGGAFAGSSVSCAMWEDATRRRPPTAARKLHKKVATISLKLGSTTAHLDSKALVQLRRTRGAPPVGGRSHS